MSSIRTPIINASNTFHVGSEYSISLVTLTASISLLTLLGLLTIWFVGLSDPLPGVPSLKGFSSTLGGFMYTYLKHGVPELVNQIAAIGKDGLSYASVCGTVVVCVQEPTLFREVLNLPSNIASREGDPGRTIWSPFATLRRLAGKTLFAETDSSIWLPHRKVFNREFNVSKSLAEKFDTISRFAQAHADAMTTDQSATIVTDIKRATDDYVISVWGEILYGNPLNHVDSSVWNVSEKVLFLSGNIWGSVKYSIHNFLGMLPPRSSTGSEAKVRKEVVDIIDRNMKVLCHYEKNNKEAPLKLMRRLSIITGGKKNGPLSEFASEFANLNVFGGHVYIGSLVSFVLIELNKHPECLKQLLAEIDVTDTSNYAAMNYQMPYLDAIISEMLRLYPGVTALLRIVNRRVALTSYKAPVVLKPGMLIICSLVHMHTSKKYWGADALEFIPERFLQGTNKGNPAFLPVGYGPRSCVAYKVGILFTKVFLVALLKMYRLDVVGSDYNVVVGSSSLLESTKPVTVKVSRRLAKEHAVVTAA